MKKIILASLLLASSGALAANIENPFFLAGRGRTYFKTALSFVDWDNGEDFTNILGRIGLGVTDYTNIYADLGYANGSDETSGFYSPKFGAEMRLFPGSSNILHLFAELDISMWEQKRTNVAASRHALTFGAKYGWDTKQYALAFVPAVKYNFKGSNNSWDASVDGSFDLSLAALGQYYFTNKFSGNGKVYFDVLSEESGDYNTLGFAIQGNYEFFDNSLASAFFDVGFPGKKHEDSVISMGLKFGMKL